MEPSQKQSEQPPCQPDERPEFLLPTSARSTDWRRLTPVALRDRSTPLTDLASQFPVSFPVGCSPGSMTLLPQCTTNLQPQKRESDAGVEPCPTSTPSSQMTLLCRS